MTTAIHNLGSAAVATPLEAPVCGTPEMQMLVLMVQTQLVQGDVAKTSVGLSEQQLKDLREQVREAMDKAHEAEKDSGFMGAIGDVLGGDVGTLAGLVMMAAAAVVTGGAAAAVLATIAIGCTLASKYGDELGIPPKVALGLGFAAAAASIASGNIGGLTGATTTATAGGAAASSAASASSATASAGSTAGAAASAGTAAASGASAAVSGIGCAGQQASKLTQIAKEVHFYTRFVAAGANGGGAIAHTAQGYYHGKSVDRTADAEAVRSKETLENMDIDTAIDLFEKTVDWQLSATNQALGMAQSRQQSTQLIIHSFQGAA